MPFVISVNNAAANWFTSGYIQNKRWNISFKEILKKILFYLFLWYWAGRREKEKNWPQFPLFTIIALKLFVFTFIPLFFFYYSRDYGENQFIIFFFLPLSTLLLGISFTVGFPTKKKTRRRVKWEGKGVDDF